MPRAATGLNSRRQAHLGPLLPLSTRRSQWVNVYQICGRRGDQVSCWECDDPEIRDAAVYTPPVVAFEGTPVSHLASGAFRVFAQVSDTSVVVRNRSLGSLEPLGTFTVDGTVPPTAE